MSTFCLARTRASIKLASRDAEDGDVARPEHSVDPALALDDERERAIAALRDAYVDDQLTLEQFSDCADSVYAALTNDELDAAVRAVNLPRGQFSLAVPTPPLHLAGRIRDHLLDGERLLWVGQPDPRKHFTRADRFLIPFSVLWGGFALSWESVALFATSDKGSHAPISFPVIGFLFTVLGIYFMVGRFFYKAYTKKRTTYAITDRRVLVLTGPNSLDAMFLGSIPSVSQPGVSHDGAGTVAFGRGSGASAIYANTGMEFLGRTNGTAPLAFYDIHDAATAADLAMKLIDAQTH
jgi:Domain of unknown function (DUF1707)